MFIAVLFFSTSSFAGLFTATKPKEVCTQIALKDARLGIECDRLISDKNNTYDADYLDWCMTVAQLAKKVSSASAEDGLTCLKETANKKLSSIPKKQIEFCSDLQDSNMSRAVLNCIAYAQPPELIEVCKKTLQIGKNYQAADGCMSITKKFKNVGAQEIESAKKCFSDQTKGPMKVNTWSEIFSCMNDVAPAETPSSTGSRGTTGGTLGR